MRWMLIWGMLLLVLSVSETKAQTKEQLKQALIGCEKDLNTSLKKIEQLQRALKETSELSERRKALADSLVANLQSQIRLQTQINRRLQANADTLQLMVRDYDQKLDEIAGQYRKLLAQKSRPWFFTWNGLQGLATGVLVGGALGLVFGLAH